MNNYILNEKLYMQIVSLIYFFSQPHKRAYQERMKREPTDFKGMKRILHEAENQQTSNNENDLLTEGLKQECTSFGDDTY